MAILAVVRCPLASGFFTRSPLHPLPMNHFLHKHRIWLAVLVAVAVAGIIYFQVFTGDEAIEPGPPNQPSGAIRGVE